MRITAISDLHGFFPELSGGDLLILCGDYTSNGKLTEWASFFEWLKKQKYIKKIIIAGNHDNFLFDSYPQDKEIMEDLKKVQQYLKDIEEMGPEDFEYLCDSGTEFEGLKIWGSPWSLYFDQINPIASFFTGTENCINEKFENIPKDTDILITHSPPFGILDEIDSGCLDRNFCGSKSLNRQVLGLINIKIHFFGHIHEWGGKSLDATLTKFYNVSYVDEEYRPRKSVMNLEI